MPRWALLLVLISVVDSAHWPTTLAEFNRDPERFPFCDAAVEIPSVVVTAMDGQVSVQAGLPGADPPTNQTLRVFVDNKVPPCCACPPNFLPQSPGLR